MPTINVLPKSVAELIAAGEVVEKPASVIKEITENSIDAGATKITVEIRRGGIMYMRVTDNGCGIEKKDVPTAFLRHATSKILTGDDLNSIMSLGFRGEALASIASVSRVEMLTCTECDNIGTRYVIEGGEQKAFEDAGCPIGTTIIVRDLFYNTPARMKFLKKDVYEGNIIADLVEKLALSHPEISFQLIREGKTVFTSPGDGKLLSAVYSVLGREFSSTLIEANNTFGGITVEGFVTKPVYSRAKRNAQFFFLNGRLIRSATAVAALEAAYKNSMMVGKFPACVLHITLNPETVDVNVHPAKTEVRFSDEKAVFDAIFFAAKNALQKGDTRPNITPKKPLKFSAFEHLTADEYRQAVMTEQIKPESAAKQFPRPEPIVFHDVNCKPQQEKEPVLPQQTEAPEVKNTEKLCEFEPDFKAETPVVSEKPKITLAKDNPAEPVLEVPLVSDKSVRFIGEAFSTYIIAEQGENLYLIDKHAAHERIIFEKLKRDIKHQSQELLLPVTVKLDAENYASVLDSLDMLLEAGFVLEDFGNNTVICRAVPPIIAGDDIKSIIEELAAGLSEKHAVSLEKLDNVYHTVACKAAIKGGNKNSASELTRLAYEVLSRDDIMYCPHGRPVAYQIKRRELEKQFGRIQ